MNRRSTDVLRRFLCPSQPQCSPYCFAGAQSAPRFPSENQIGSSGKIFNFLLTNPAVSGNIYLALRQDSQTRQILGGIAQLGERLNGIQEVSGSIPLISTNSQGYAKALKTLCFQGFLLFSFPWYCPSKNCSRKAKAHRKAHNLRKQRANPLIRRKEGCIKWQTSEKTRGTAKSFPTASRSVLDGTRTTNRYGGTPLGKPRKV